MYCQYECSRRDAVSLGSWLIADGRQGKRALLRCNERHADNPPIGILQANCVILAQIATGLHLDYFQFGFSGLAQAVDLANGNVGGLVFRQQERFGAAGDLGCAFDDYPVFCAVMVHLQA